MECEVSTGDTPGSGIIRNACRDLIISTGGNKAMTSLSGDRMFGLAQEGPGLQSQSTTFLEALIYPTDFTQKNISVRRHVQLVPPLK